MSKPFYFLTGDKVEYDLAVGLVGDYYEDIIFDGRLWDNSEAAVICMNNGEIFGRIEYMKNPLRIGVAPSDCFDVDIDWIKQHHPKKPKKPTLEDVFSEILKEMKGLREKQEMTNVLLAELVEIFSEGDREPEEMQSAGYQPQSLDD